MKMTIWQVLKHLQKVEYLSALGIKTRTDAVNFYLALKARGIPSRP
jgi:hypothetical protein